MLVKPKEAARKQARFFEMGEGIKSLAIMVFLAGLLGTILMGIGLVFQSFVSLAVGGMISDVMGAAITAILSFAGYILLFVPAYLVWLISLFVGIAFIWGIAKLLGGKSTYGSQFGALTEPIAAIILITSLLGGIFFIVVSMIAPLSAMAATIFSALFGLVLFGLWLYGIWIEIIYTAEANEFVLWKAAVSVLLPMFLAVLAVAVLVAILIALFSMAALTSIAGAFPV